MYSIDLDKELLGVDEGLDVNLVVQDNYVAKSVEERKETVVTDLLDFKDVVVIKP